MLRTATLAIGTALLIILIWQFLGLAALAAKAGALPREASLAGCPDQITERDRLRHHSVRKLDVKRLLQSQQQLHPFKAADSQVALE